MNIQSVNRPESWSQFMQIVQDARARTNAVAARPREINGSSKAGQLYMQPMANMMQARSTAAVSGISQVGQRGVPAKILGGLFDAYA